MKKQKKIAPKKASNKKKRKKTPRRKQKSTKIPQTIVSVVKYTRLKSCASFGGKHNR